MIKAMSMTVRIFVAAIPVRLVNIIIVASIVPSPNMAFIYKAIPNEKTIVPNMTIRNVGNSASGCMGPINRFEKTPVKIPLIKLPIPICRRSMRNTITRTMALKILIMVPRVTGMCLVRPSRKVLRGSTPCPDMINKLTPIAIINVPKMTTRVFNENCLMFKFITFFLVHLVYFWSRLVVLFFWATLVPNEIL